MALRHHKRRVATGSRASVSYETSSKSHASRLQDERFVRDFLQKSRVKSPKRAFHTRLPPKVTRQVSKTSVSYETSSKSHVSSLQNYERFVRDFLRNSHVKVCKTSVSYETSHRSTPASLAAQRSFLTYVASITHDPRIQPLLPQVLIGNEHQFTKRLLGEVASQIPSPKIHMWRKKSAWMCHASMRQYLSLLRKSLGEHARERYVILLVDVFAGHIDKSIYLHARNCGIRICYIPAGMTRWLQPCDTHLFARFKQCFQERWRDQKSKVPLGIVSEVEWIKTICLAIQQVVPGGSWGASCDQDVHGVTRLDAEEWATKEFPARFNEPVTHTSLTLEESLESGSPRVHLHAQFTFGRKVDRAKLVRGISERERGGEERERRERERRLTFDSVLKKKGWVCLGEHTLAQNP